MSNRDTEITLGTGRLLVLFFGFVFICAVFFGLGYQTGRSSVEAAAIPKPAAVSVEESGTPKPEAGQPEASQPQASSELTFYRSVKETQPESRLQKPSPELKEQKPAPTAAARPAGGFVVQVAAVSKSQDAENLASALRSKQYPVFVSDSRADNLFRVQVGPFADLAGAESTRARLMQEGYNPIVRR